MKIFNDIFEAMEARRRRENKIAASIFGVGCLSLIGLGIVIAIVTTIMNAVETASVNQIYGEVYASACDPVPAGRESLDNIPDTATPRKILLLTADSQRRDEWQSELPAQWRAENEAEVVLIGCVQTERLLLETCEYPRTSDEGDGYTVKIEREQYETTLIILDARTTRRIDSMSMRGSEPDACPVDDGRIGSGNRRGEPVAWADFAVWLEGYIFEN